MPEQKRERPFLLTVFEHKMSLKGKLRDLKWPLAVTVWEAQLLNEP
jgi:hypothetical protein